MDTIKAAHTPGPWTEQYGGVYIITQTGKNRLLADIQDVNFAPEGMSTHEIPLHLKGIRKANARLIAAAPEMLEALERLVDSRGDDRWELAWAAIQKARGAQ